MKKFFLYCKYGGLAFALGPFLIALVSLPLSFVFDCTDGGGSPGSCAIGGDSMGNVVWTLAMFHWFTLLTIVPGLGIFLVGLLGGIFTNKKKRAEQVGK